MLLASWTKIVNIYYMKSKRGGEFLALSVEKHEKSRYNNEKWLCFCENMSENP